MEVPVAARPTGDPFTAWVESYLPDLRRFAVYLTGHVAADDLVQDTLARAWVKHDQFDPARGSAKAWLFAIMADQRRRRQNRTHRAALLEVPRAGAQPGTGESASTRLDLRRAVDALPQRQRAAVTLHYYLDLSVADVAELMKCSVGTVKSTLHDARLNLTERLGEPYA